MEVIVMKVKRKEGSAVVTGVIRACVGPFAGDGLDEAFGLAVGLGTIGFGEAVFEAELLAGGGEELGAISGAAVGEDTLDGDAMVVVKGDGLVEGGEDAGSFFVWEEGGEGETGMVVDGNVKRLDAGTWVALGFVAGGGSPVHRPPLSPPPPRRTPGRAKRPDRKSTRLNSSHPSKSRMPSSA